MTSENWKTRLEPLLQQYRGRKHPLEYRNRYQLMVMVILSAQDSDRHINALAGPLFAAYPTLTDLAKARAEDLQALLSSVRNFENKVKWLLTLAQILGSDDHIPRTLPELVKLPGIGRKSANVIVRESGGPAEGIIVDLHVLRVAPRIGIAQGTQPEKIEKQLMSVVPQDSWSEAGMAFSFLGREICRPTNPACPRCVMNSVCDYYRSLRRPSGT